jgi:hypothetical protein
MRCAQLAQFLATVVCCFSPGHCRAAKGASRQCKVRPLWESTIYEWHRLPKIGPMDDDLTLDSRCSFTSAAHPTSANMCACVCVSVSLPQPSKAKQSQAKPTLSRVPETSRLHLAQSGSGCYYCLYNCSPVARHADLPSGSSQSEIRMLACAPYSE